MGYTVAMLSLFPEILFLAPFSALIIRVAVAALLAYAAWTHVAERNATVRALSFFEGLVGAAILVGAWTQAAAILAAIFFVLPFVSSRMRLFATSTLLVALVLCASLIVTGAGALAFDLPL